MHECPKSNVIKKSGEAFYSKGDPADKNMYFIHIKDAFVRYMEDAGSNLIWDKVFKSGLSKFFKGCLPQNLLSPLLNTLSQLQID